MKNQQSTKKTKVSQFPESFNDRIHGKVTKVGETKNGNGATYLINEGDHAGGHLYLKPIEVLSRFIKLSSQHPATYRLIDLLKEKSVTVAEFLVFLELDKFTKEEILDTNYISERIDIHKSHKS
jgi:hypothetical protein